MRQKGAKASVGSGWIAMHRIANCSTAVWRRLALSLGAQIFSFGIQIGSQILMVPLFLHKWGPELYANWLLLLAVSALVGLLDFGLQTYFSNQIRMEFTGGNQEGAKTILQQALGIYICLFTATISI